MLYLMCASPFWSFVILRIEPFHLGRTSFPMRGHGDVPICKGLYTQPETSSPLLPVFGTPFFLFFFFSFICSGP